jgi:hypothetical protein
MSGLLLQTAQLEFLSDPPGIPLYYKMGTDVLIRMVSSFTPPSMELIL